jgi:hypothetical protein
MIRPGGVELRHSARSGVQALRIQDIALEASRVPRPSTSFLPSWCLTSRSPGSASPGLPVAGRDFSRVATIRREELSLTGCGLRYLLLLQMQSYPGKLNFIPARINGKSGILKERKIMGRELYVRHISEKATENEIRKHFSIAGTVVSVHLVTDPETGQFKGCGFVRMATENEAQEAITTLDGALLIDRIILVSEALPQKQKGSKSGGYKGKKGKDNRPGRVHK